MENDIKILSPEEVEIELGRLDSGWQSIDGNKIKKTFEFKSFTDGTKLLCELGPFCDEINHHPDITINYKKFTFELTRHDIGGKLTDKDFFVANKIEQLFEKLYQ